MSESESATGTHGDDVRAGSVPLIERADGPVLRLLLNRPAKRNALDSGLVAALGDALRRAGADQTIRVITVAGVGEDFSAGADLASLERLASAPIVDNLRDAEALADLFLAIRHVEKPVVALVRGRALAGGCGLATACDVVLAANGASFGYPEVRLGFVPAIVTAILRRNVSEKRAFQLMAMGDVYPAAEMERIGLINRVYPDADFDAGAEAFVRTLAARSGSSIAAIKRHLHSQDSMTFDSAMASGVAVNALARLTDDAREGISDFLRSRGGRKA